MFWTGPWKRSRVAWAPPESIVSCQAVSGAPFGLSRSEDAARDRFSETKSRRCIMAYIVQRQGFDARYVTRLVESDPATERHFVEYFSRLLQIKLRTRLRAPDLIQEVIQETFQRVLRKLKTGVENPEALGSFVNSVCNNVLFELYREQSRVTEAPVDRPSEDLSVEVALLDEEQRGAVLAVIEELPDKDRKILRWLFFEERDKDDICRTLEVDREYLRVLVHRAKTRFRTEFLKRDATKSDRTTPLR